MGRQEARPLRAQPGSDPNPRIKENHHDTHAMGASVPGRVSGFDSRPGWCVRPPRLSAGRRWAMIWPLLTVQSALVAMMTASRKRAAVLRTVMPNSTARSFRQISGTGGTAGPAFSPTAPPGATTMRSVAQSVFVDEDDDSARFLVSLNLGLAGGQGHWRNPARARRRWRPQGRADSCCDVPVRRVEGR